MKIPSTREVTKVVTGITKDNIFQENGLILGRKHIGLDGTLRGTAGKPIQGFVGLSDGSINFANM